MKGRNWNNPSVQKLIKEANGNDPISEIRTRARSLILEAYEKGWAGPPFDPFQLAKLTNIKVVPNELIHDARILKQSNSSQIEYNPFQRPTRINFSIAHEIGHYLFKDWSENIRNREGERDTNLWELEFLCDVAASEILLPYSEFAEEANNQKLNMNSLLDIAKKYQASLEAVFLRFTEVINKPCAILIASFQDENKEKLIIDYFKGSNSFPLTIPVNYDIPKKSKSYECINSGWTSENLENWEVFGNVSFKIYSIGLPPVKKFKKQRVGIFIAPEFYDNKPERSIYTVNGDATQPRGEGKKIIAQLVNTTAGVGFGFGRAMASKWPKSKKELHSWKNRKDFSLGNSQLIQLDDEVFVFQMLAQKGIKPKHEGDKIISYIALQKCLKELRQEALRYNASIHMPMIGAGQARGDWNIIEGMIFDELVQHNIVVTTYVLPGTKFNPKNKSPLTLTLFDT